MAITRLKGPINSINQVIFVLNKVIDAVNAYIAGAGTVTSITAGTGLSGGTITGSGTIGIANAAPNSLAGYDAAGVFANVAVGSGLTLTGNTLTSTGSGGTVTNVSVITANGFAGTVATSTTTPAITLTTTITGLLKGDGTAISAAVAGTDYQAPGNYITALTGDVTATGPGSVVATISANSVTNAKLADMPANTFKANNTGASGDPLDITGTQATAMLDIFTSALKGLAPASGGGTINFLRADGTFAAPVFSVSFTSSDQTITSAGALTLAHGLGVAPKFIYFELVNVTAQHGYTVGDVLYISPITTGTNNGCAVTKDATNINIRYGSRATVFDVTQKTTGTNQTATNANWRLRVTAYA